MGISFLYYYFVLSINQPIVDHTNGIINLGNSKKIYGALHFCIGHHGSEKVSVNLGGLDRARAGFFGIDGGRGDVSGEPCPANHLFLSCP